MADQHPTRVRWHHRERATVEHDGTTIQLPTMPVLLGEHVLEIDYLDRPRCARLRESAQAWRDMTAAEVHVLHAWASLLTAAVQLHAFRFEV